MLVLTLVILLGQHADANANIPFTIKAGVGPGNDGTTSSTSGSNNTGSTNKGNDDKTNTTDKSTKPNTNGWVVIEVIDDKAEKTEQVSVEKKNISQVEVTWVEVRTCQRNTTPEELIPLLKEISQTNSNRKVYCTEENGKKIYYISPATEGSTSGSTTTTTNSSEPTTLTLPVLWQIKI